MEENELVPYFHPTQIVLVDNDIDFLGNLSLQLDADLAYLLFDSTTKALGYINDIEMRAPSRQRFFQLQDVNGHKSDQRSPGVTLDTGALMREMYYTDRFSQISVVMVDYAMPQMNGLEFCKRIRNPHIKKILFTGVASEEDAVKAFNEGIIDRFIRKSEHQVYDHLNRTIRALQFAYIRDTFVAASDVLEVDTPPILADRAVVELMADIRARHGFVEYYLVSNPWGFMLVDGDGHVSRLVLWDENYRAAQLAHARTQAAPPDCLEALARGEVILDPVLMSVEAGGANELYRDWRRYARPGTRLRGGHKYWWALFEQPGILGMVGPPIATYNRYLEWLDTVGYSLM